MFRRIAILCLLFGGLLTFASCFWRFSVHAFDLSFVLVFVLNQSLHYDDVLLQYLLDSHLPKVLLELLEDAERLDEHVLVLVPIWLVQLIVFGDLRYYSFIFV